MMVLWAIRFFAFKLYESPKFLMGRGKDKLAVEVVHKVAKCNRTESSLSLEALQSLGGHTEKDPKDNRAFGVIQENLEIFGVNHVKPLFASRTLAWSTGLLIVLWGEDPQGLCHADGHWSKASFSSHWISISLVRQPSILWIFSLHQSHRRYNAFVTY